MFDRIDVAFCEIFAKTDQLQTKVCRTLCAEPPVPDDVKLPARWATAVEEVQFTLAWIDRESRR